MSRYIIPTLVPGALYEFRSKATLSIDGRRTPDGYITIILKFVREDGLNYVWFMKRTTINGQDIFNNENYTTETTFSKEDISKTFVVLKYEPTTA